MDKKKLISNLAGALALSAAAIAVPGFAGVANAASLSKVTMMVGGIDKQIYLEYQLAKSLGLFEKYGIDMQLSTEQDGGVDRKSVV